MKLKKKVTMINLLFIYHIAAIWGEWGVWESCSTTCGDGIKTRVKECLNSDFSNISCDGEQPK